MNLDDCLRIEAHCAGHLTPAFLDQLGDPLYEQFYVRAHELAVKQNLPDVAAQAQAWLVFSEAARKFSDHFA